MPLTNDVCLHMCLLIHLRLKVAKANHLSCKLEGVGGQGEETALRVVGGLSSN